MPHTKESREVKMLRIDHIKDRDFYISNIRAWLEELKLNGRLLNMGRIWLLIIEGDSIRVTQFIDYYSSREVDIDSTGKSLIDLMKKCKDRFFDILGSKAIQQPLFKDFHEMQILNQDLLEALVVNEWTLEKRWLDISLATERTKSFLAWKIEMKSKRKEDRKRKAMAKSKEKLKMVKLDKEVTTQSSVQNSIESDTNGNKQLMT